MSTLWDEYSLPFYLGCPTQMQCYASLPTLRTRVSSLTPSQDLKLAGNWPLHRQCRGEERRFTEVHSSSFTQYRYPPASEQQLCSARSSSSHSIAHSHDTNNPSPQSSGQPRTEWRQLCRIGSPRLRMWPASYKPKMHRLLSR